MDYSLNSFTLRGYQIGAVKTCRENIKRGKRKQIFVSPTGSGKTKLIIFLVYYVLIKREPVLIITPKDFILSSFLEDLSKEKIPYSVIQSGKEKLFDPDCLLQIATYQTLVSWIKKGKYTPKAKWIFIDEAHRVRAKSYKIILELYPEAFIFGFSATPARLDGQPLGGIGGFDAMIECATIPELIKLGFLVPAKYYGVEEYPDLDGVSIVGGDFHREQLNARCNQPHLNGLIVNTWEEKSLGLQTLFFGASTDHSKEVCNRFNDYFRGRYRAIHIDGKTPKKERLEILEGFKSKYYNFLGNCILLGEGWNVHGIECISDARPTLSTAFQRQKWGRAMRPDEGKDFWICLDHANNHEDHGHPEDEIEWSLEKKPKIINKSINRRCPDCFFFVKITKKKCICGYEFKTETEGLSEKQINERSIKLKEIKREEFRKKKNFYAWLIVERDYLPDEFLNKKGHKRGEWASIMNSRDRSQVDPEVWNSFQEAVFKMILDEKQKELFKMFKNVREMRFLQESYFKTRDRNTLIRAKCREKDVDQFLKENRANEIFSMLPNNQ